MGFSSNVARDFAFFRSFFGAVSHLALKRFSHGCQTSHSNPTRKRGDRLCMWCRSRPGSLACASALISQTTTIVTPSPHAIISPQVLLELARWCQQRLASTEECNRCHIVNSTRQSPPAQVALTALPDDSSLARAGATTTEQPASPVDHAAAPTRRPRRSPRNGGGR